MTAVMRAADAPRAASSISSSSIRCSWTGGDSGWMMKTSASRQLALSWTLRQSLLNRAMAAWLSGLFRCLQIDFASSRVRVPAEDDDVVHPGVAGCIILLSHAPGAGVI